MKTLWGVSIVVAAHAVVVASQGHDIKQVLINNPKYVGTPVVSCKDIQYIVDYHNNVRRALGNGTLERQPRAYDMQTIVWDPRLAEIASNWSKKMIFGHNPDRYDSRYLFGAVGENLFMTASNNPRNRAVEWQRPLNAWFYEHNYYWYEATHDDPTTGHYTQMIWSTTIHVGCATTQFTGQGNWLYKYYVCNYGPSGNWLDNFPYADSGFLDEIQSLIAAGIDVSSLHLCDGPLCCDYDQCRAIYGPKCA